MEEESFSCSSSQSIKNYQVPDYMKKTQDDLSQVLLGIDEFQDKRKIIPYFAQYEFESQKQKMHAFWTRSIEQVMKKHEKSCILSIDYLHQVFNFNGFQPMSLKKVIDELVEENNFALAGNKVKIMKMLNLDTNQQLKEEEKRKEVEHLEMEKQQKKQGFFQKLNIFNYFKGQKDSNTSMCEQDNKSNTAILQQITEIQEQNNFIINKSLMIKHFAKFRQFLNSYCWHNDHFAFESDILQEASKVGMNMGEVKLFLELLEKDGQMKTFGDKELGKKIIFYDKDKKSQMNEEYFQNASVLFSLEYNIQMLEKNIQKYTEQQSELKKKILECKETEKAKKNQYLREYLIYQKTIDNILNKKQTLKKNQLHVEDAITNKRVLNVLNQGVATAKMNQVDTAVLEDIKEQLDEVNAQDQEVQDIFQQFNALNQSEQEALDKEIEELMQENGFSDIQEKPQVQQNYNQYNPQNNNDILFNINYDNNNNNNNFNVNANNNKNNNKMDVEEEVDLKLLNELG